MTETDREKERKFENRIAVEQVLDAPTRVNCLLLLFILKKTIDNFP
jgi:hypothetical protein